MKITGEKVILRDMTEPDIDDFIRWYTTETEWRLWDGPWETIVFDPEAYRRKIFETLAQPKDEARPRRGFQICLRDEHETHIGWMNAYFIGGDYRHTKEKGHIAIGINIPEQWARGRGCAAEAWTLFIGYLRENGAADIYAQTWSGNQRVLGLMKKLGFEECDRKPGVRTVRGGTYDALTFRLGPDGPLR